jgi:hypothetical protein
MRLNLGLNLGIQGGSTVLPGELRGVTNITVSTSGNLAGIPRELVSDGAININSTADLQVLKTLVGTGAIIINSTADLDVGSTPWTPADLGASLALWLDADDASTITLNGSNVAQWNDKSGNDHHVIQSTASAQPTYISTGFNSKPTLFFDATDDVLACATTNVSSQGDLFYGAAFEMLSNTDNWRPIVGTDTSENTSNGGTLLLQRMSSRSEIGIHDSGRKDTGNTYAVQVTDLFEPRIATAGRNGGTNGQGGTITVTATGPSQPTYITQATQTWSTDEVTSRIQIGGKQQNQTGWADAYISEVIVCNTDLSTQDRQKLEGYLAWKWGLEADLPSGHPYKSTPPTV